jgi:4-amino-4-deoxy-L-arabinose transferase-like glycosyltransferase
MTARGEIPAEREGVDVSDRHMVWFSSSAFRLLAGTALALVVLAVSLLAGVPPVDRDALTHHLAVPKLYLQHGGIYEIPAVPFSYYPMNLDMLYLAALYIGNDILPKYIHFVFALLTCVLLFRYLQEKLRSAAYGLLGCILFLSLPVVVKLSISVYVDLGLIFFSTAALLQLFRWAESGFRIRHLLLAGIWTGLCLGTKYNGILSAFLLGLVVLILSQRAPAGPCGAESPPPAKGQGRRCLRAMGRVLLFCAAALVVYAPWMMRNFVWTGNPVYPLAAGVFVSGAARTPETQRSVDGGGSDISPGENTEPGLNHFAVRAVVFGENLPDILLIPVRIFFQGVDDDPQYFDGRLNPYLLLFPIAALVLARRNRRPSELVLHQRLMGGFALLYLLLSFLLTDMRVRYVGPILPPLVLLAVYGIHDLISLFQSSSTGILRRLGPAVLSGALILLLEMNGAYMQDLFGRVEPFGYLAGKVSRDEYIQKHRPEYDTIAYVNRNLPSNARVLCLFTGNRIYYSDREMVCDSELFRAAILSKSSADAVAEHFRRKKISHLLLNGDIFRQWADSQFDETGRALLLSLFQGHLNRIYQSHGYFLFEVLRG